jgi:hypothetical protein
MQQDNQVPSVLRQVAFSALVAGVLMVLVGFPMGLQGTSRSEVYNTSVTAFVWLMRGGGISMLLVAVLAFVGWERVLALDAVLATVIGAGMAIVALLWLANSDLVSGVLILVFGGMFVRSGIQSWQAFRSLGPKSMEPEAPPTPPEPNTDIPTTRPWLRREKRDPQTDERVRMPAPDEAGLEGFLADLGKSDDRVDGI